MLVDNGGILKDLQQLAAPGADALLAYDFGTTSAKGFTLGAGLEFSGDTINVADAVAGAGLAVASSVLSVGAGLGITANADDIQLTDSAGSSTNPIEVASGVISLDIQNLANIEGSALAATDEFIVDDAGAAKAIQVQAMGLRVQNSQTTQTIAAADMNSIMEFAATATLTLPSNSTVDLPLGVPIILNVKHATQVLTVLAGSGATLVSVNHPAGASTVSDTVDAGGTALLYKTGNNTWVLSGDISD